MTHIGCQDKDWADSVIGSNPLEDLFHCDCCDVDFSIESGKICGRNISCPICLKHLKAWQKEWVS